MGFNSGFKGLIWLVVVCGTGKCSENLQWFQHRGLVYLIFSLLWYIVNCLVSIGQWVVAIRLMCMFETYYYHNTIKTIFLLVMFVLFIVF